MSAESSVGQLFVRRDSVGRLLLNLTLGLGLVFSASRTVSAAQDQSKPASPDQSGQQRPGARPGGQTGPGREQGPRAFGTISSVGVDRFEIKRMDGAAQAVMVNDQTRYMEGGRDAQKQLGLEDLKPGDRVFVQGKMNGSNDLVAGTVRRVTDQDMQRFSSGRTGGEITSINGNQIQVRNPRQGDKTIVVNEQTNLVKDGQPITLKDLKVGDRVFAIGQETNGQFVATRIFTGQFRMGGGAGGSRRERPDKSQ